MDDTGGVLADEATIDATGPRPPARGELQTLAAGQSIGRYVVLERIGIGGMGVVYAAYDPELDRKVAVKLLLADARADEEQRNRLVREAQAMAQLNHPNVIGVHDVGDHEGAVFVAMEFVDGRTLGAAVAEEPEDHVRTIRMFVAAGHGLAAAHAAGLVHRDFKPDNVLAGHDGRVRVLDFGLARPECVEPPAPEDEDPSASLSGSSRRLSDRLTRTGRVLGTPAYMAPEQFAGGTVDPRTDQFSFCVALWEALVGARPFTGDSYAALATAVTSGNLAEPLALRSVRPHVRKALRRGLQRDPAERFPSMGALLAELEHDPGARRQRFIAAGLAGGALFGLGLAVTSLGEQAPTCTRADEALAGVWDDARAGTIADAFESSDLAYASVVFDDIRRRLDRYAETWSTAYADNCQATRVRHEQSAELYDLRQRCLLRRRDALQQLVDHLERADAKVVDGAALAAGELPDLQTCSDPQRVRLVLPEHRDLEREAEAERFLDTARLDEHLTGEKAAIDSAERALQIGRELEHLPIQAQALTQLGSALDNAGDYERAEASLREGLWLAYRAGDDATVVDAATTLVLVVGIRLERLAEAEIFAQVGLAASRRAGAMQRAPYLHAQVGMLELKLGHEASARHHFDAALDELRAQGGDDDAAMASLVSNAAIAYYQRGDFELAHAEYTRALQMFEATYGPEHPAVASALHNLAMTTAARLDVEGGIAHMRRAVALRRKLLGDDHPETGNSLSNLGVLLQKHGDLDEAQQVLETAIAGTQRTSPDNPMIPIMQGNLAEVLRSAGELDAAQELFAVALTGVEKVFGREHPYMAYPRSGLGMVHLQAGRPDLARPLFERTLALDLSSVPDDDLLGATRFGLARALRATGDDDVRARELATAARENYARIGETAQVETIDAFLAVPPTSTGPAAPDSDPAAVDTH